RHELQGVPEERTRQRKAPPRGVGVAPAVPDLRVLAQDTSLLDKEAASLLCFDRPYVKFEGASQTHEDFQPPPLDAFSRPRRPEEASPLWAGGPNACGGESQTHADFKPPPLPTLLPLRANGDKSQYWEERRLAGQLVTWHALG
ncbi:unnamed protein product, partial [Durusdinium trenchii]